VQRLGEGEARSNPENFQGKRTKFSSIYNCLKNDDHPGCPAGTFHAFALENFYPFVYKSKFSCNFALSLN
jgi:hypothetical protein